MGKSLMFGDSYRFLLFMGIESLPFHHPPPKRKPYSFNMKAVTTRKCLMQKVMSKAKQFRRS